MTTKLGSILLFPRGGFIANLLYWPIRFFDPDPWVRKNHKVWGRYWHMAFITGKDSRYDEWVARSVELGGTHYRRLSEFKKVPVVVNWIATTDSLMVWDYLQQHAIREYSALGYLICTLNRLTRGIFPAWERKGKMYCWQDAAEWAEFNADEWMPYGEMAYMPLFVKKAVERGLL